MKSVQDQTHNGDNNMFRVSFAQGKPHLTHLILGMDLLSLTGSRSILSSGSQSSSSCLHTSALLNAQVSRKNVARGVKKVNNVKKEERWKRAQATRPSVVLGTRPGEEAKWENCDLAKVLVDVEELTSSTELMPSKLPVGTVLLPKQMSFGIGDAEKEMLFEKLPIVSAQAQETTGHDRYNPAAQARQRATSQVKELLKANAFAKLLDLRNANAGGIAFENRRRIIAAFSTPTNPFDPGRSEVQGEPTPASWFCGH